MRIVVFGLTISSSWGNGHATLWRGLCRALAVRGHSVIFYERDAPYYAEHRDACSPAGCTLRLYDEWCSVRSEAAARVDEADVALVTSFCPDAEDASALVLESRAAVKSYYDMDTPVTLDAIARGRRPSYVPQSGLSGFDIVFSYTGGGALDGLRSVLGARVAVPLYGSVDPASHHPVGGRREEEPWALSYLGTYAADRQAALEHLFLEPARRRPNGRFALAGSQYPADFPWLDNVYYLLHLPPGDHPRFYAQSAWTLNITRGPMAALGYCPSGRLFEAAACGAAIVTDAWEGLDAFFTPGEEIVIAHDTADVLAALDLADGERRRIGRRARERAIECHTAAARALDFERAVRAVAAHYPGRTPGVTV